MDAAALLWAGRGLSAAQARTVAEVARSLRGDSSVEYRIDLPGWPAETTDGTPAAS